ncbi:MAG: hypothetical protein MUF44_11395 [Hydrogenophaga sp.]|nr:hypothetical protein [Hydrogenophaga sp.]
MNSTRVRQIRTAPPHINSETKRSSLHIAGTLTLDEGSASNIFFLARVIQVKVKRPQIVALKYETGA